MTPLAQARLSIARGAPRQPNHALVIGVVNNMPKAAFQATANQFGSLLRQAAPDDIDLQLRFFWPGDRQEPELEADRASRQHEGAQDLWAATLDGLIVTGAEPQAAQIADEPCLPFLSRIVDWADAAALPTIWSCLAAHAAVYRLDGIERRQLDAKLSGVFQCNIARHHPLFGGIDTPWIIPHSRRNELSDMQLTECGYQILTHSTDVGADTFVKQSGAMHVFLNGHPEYGKTTLHSEYRRDVRRFLHGEWTEYPAIPTGYFTDRADRELAMFRETALALRTPELMERFPAAAATSKSWKTTANSLFRNWLCDVARQKVDRAGQIHVGIASDQASISRQCISPSSNQIAPGLLPGQLQAGRTSL